jgi:hypothetical protein
VPTTIREPQLAHRAEAREQAVGLGLPATRRAGTLCALPGGAVHNRGTRAAPHVLGPLAVRAEDDLADQQSRLEQRRRAVVAPPDAVLGEELAHRLHGSPLRAHPDRLGYDRLKLGVEFDVATDELAAGPLDRWST